MPTPHADEPFRLQPPPNELWGRSRMASEFGVTESTIDRWVRDGRLPRPWTHRRRRPLWAPETVEPALRRHRQYPTRTG
jgi:hypothetical protein